MSRGGLLRAVYKGLYANHRSEGRTRLQRTVLRPESDVASEHMAASIAQLRASASHHRLDSSTTDAPIEPDFQVRPQRPSCHRRTVILGPGEIGTSPSTRLHHRSCSDALALRITATAGARRTPPSSPISEFVRGGRERHRSAASCAHRSCTVTECHPSSPPAVAANAPPMAPRTPRIGAPSLRCSASRAPRSLRYHPRTASH